MAMAERPDLIAVTGDLAADSAPGFDRALGLLGGLHAPLGVYTVPGNHDYRVGIEQWRRAVSGHPVIQDLTNRALVLDVRGARLCVAGVDDLSRGDPRLDGLPDPAERDLTVLLAHNPEQAERARSVLGEIDLILSGHTHGGQVRLPGLGPLKHPRGDHHIYDQGLTRRPWTQVYTSRGVGTVHLPVRLFCRPEVTVLRISSAEVSESGPMMGTKFANGLPTQGVRGDVGRDGAPAG
jgi:predicted MPP superfamily phosphohydrolase